MKLLAIAAALSAALVLPLVADEPAATDREQKEATGTTTEAAVSGVESRRISAAPEPAPAESAMVAAARRANRLGKKPSRVITNETLKKSEGTAHITTTKVQTPVVLPTTPPRPPEAKPAVEPAKEPPPPSEEELRKAREEKEKRLAAAAEAAEQGYYEDPDHDPAIAEKAADDAAAPQEEQKPPLRD